MSFNRSTYHYPPELFEHLVQALPRLFRSKKALLSFFQGAGTNDNYLEDLNRIVASDRDSITKYEIARTILERLNQHGDMELTTRREIIKRVVEFESFDNCFPEDVMKAKGYVSEIKKIVNVKDSFTRMVMERDKERQIHIEKSKQEAASIAKQNADYDKLKQELFSLFSTNNPQDRGLKLEKILNDLFKLAGIGIKESFRVTAEEVGVYEQIDGAVEFDGTIYLVEMKWTKTPIDTGDVSTHMVRIFGRDSAKGIYISYAGYTKAAIQECKDQLSHIILTLCTIEELVHLLETRGDIKQFLKTKIENTILHKNPFIPYLP